jgi:hypothetical protein
MKERGCVGALVDGGIRDIRWIADQDFPVFARYRTPVQSIARWKASEPRLDRLDQATATVGYQRCGSNAAMSVALWVG